MSGDSAPDSEQPRTRRGYVSGSANTRRHSLLHPVEGGSTVISGMTCMVAASGRPELQESLPVFSAHHTGGTNTEWNEILALGDRPTQSIIFFVSPSLVIGLGE